LKTAVLAFLLATVTGSSAWAAGYKVIIHPSNDRGSIAKKELAQVFLKKVPKWESGTPVVPVDLQEKSAVRATFTNEVHGKSVSAVKSYWQQQIFSGRDVPPVEKVSDAEVLAFVKTNPGAIGYVSESADLGGVKVLQVR